MTKYIPLILALISVTATTSVVPMEEPPTQDASTLLYNAAYGEFADYGTMDISAMDPYQASGAHGTMDISAIGHYLAQGGNVAAEDDQGRQFIHYAAQRGNNFILTLLLLYEADVNARDRHGQQPIHLAAQHGHTTTVKLLIDKKASVDTPDYRRRHPIHFAAEGGHTETLRLLLDAGASVSSFSSPYNLQPTHLAAQGGHTEILSLLLDAGASVSTNSGGGQPIHLAAQEGHTEMLRFLLDVGASVNSVQPITKYKPIHFAAQGGHTEALRFLLANGAQMDPEFDWSRLLELSAIELSARPDDFSSPTTMLVDGQSVKVTIPHLFKMAASQNQVDILKTILDKHGTLLRERDISEALIGAATAGHTHIVALLASHVNRTNIEATFSMALARAAAQGNVKVVKYLLLQDVEYDESLLTHIRNIMQQLLRNSTFEKIVLNERLQSYSCILQALAERQRFLSYIIERRILPSWPEPGQEDYNEEAAISVPPYIRNIPEEVWMHIVRYVTLNHLYDSFEEKTRDALQAVISTLPPTVLSATLSFIKKQPGYPFAK